MPVPLLAVFSFASLSALSLPPFQREITHRTNRAWSNEIPSPTDAIELRRRDMITREEYLHYLESFGYNNKRAEKLYQAAKTLISGDANTVLYWRGEFDKEDAVKNKEIYLDRMSKLGFSLEETEQFEKSRRFYPSPSDLVTWQAREVFEEEMVEKYGLDAEFEEIDKEPFYKAGMDITQIKNYWRAHWLHPPLTVVYEMYHRGLIEKEELWAYFRLVEIPPFWRDKLIELSHPPYTRVDTRRMHAVGILDREAVKRNYMDLGYNEEKAENLTEFTIAYNMPAERDLTRSMIEKAYEYTEITRNDAVDFLINMGYDAAESNLILTLKDYTINEDIINDQIATIKALYRGGIITIEDAVTGFDKMDLKPAYRSRLIAQMMREKQAIFKLPDKDDLIMFIKKKKITEEQFTDYMKRLGYQETEINLYLETL